MGKQFRHLADALVQNVLNKRMQYSQSGGIQQKFSGGFSGGIGTLF